jgi:GTP-binding protein LepA
MEEPIARCELITPSEYIGNLMQLSKERRGIYINQTYIDKSRVLITYELPMAELI